MKHNYKKLLIWQKAMDLVVNTYQLLKKFPKEEMYQLNSQIKRASVSVPSNIAEGSGRKTEKEFSYFLFVAHGSACELDTQLNLSQRFGYISEEEYVFISKEIEEVKIMLLSFERKINLKNQEQRS